LLFDFRLTSAVCALLFSCGAAPSIVISEELRLIPFPKEVTLESGSFSLEQPLLLEVPNGSSNVIAQLLNDELTQGGLKPAEVRPLASSGPAFRLSGQTGTLKTPSLPTNDGVHLDTVLKIGGFGSSTGINSNYASLVIS